jgi:hypothetical protein
MSDEAGVSTGERIHLDHFCEFPGCSKWGGFGYDIHPPRTQWFCHEHRWKDYRQGQGPRSFFDDEAAGIDEIMIERRAVGGL